MPWVWRQSSGQLLYNREVIAEGYSGFGLGKNNHSVQSEKGIGPIPIGKWLMTGVYNSKRVGPFAIILEPCPGTETFGRSAFRIHGDSIRNPGSASNGCIILPRPIRNRIWNSKDRDLLVVE